MTARGGPWGSNIPGPPGATVTDLAGPLARTSPDVSTTLSRLVACGLVVRVGAEGFTAAPPAMALGALISERRDALRTAELALATFAEEHRAATAAPSAS